MVRHRGSPVVEELTAEPAPSGCRGCSSLPPPHSSRCVVEASCLKVASALLAWDFTVPTEIPSTPGGLLLAELLVVAEHDHRALLLRGASGHECQSAELLPLVVPVAGRPSDSGTSSLLTSRFFHARRQMEFYSLTRIRRA